MTLMVLAVVAGLSMQSATPPDQTARAYEQFLLARHLEATENIDGAIAAYKQALVFDPGGADIAAELAALYMRHSRAQEALDAADQALKIAPANREAHRVAGIVFAALAESGRSNGRPVRPSGQAGPGGPSNQPDDNAAKAIQHLEAALDRPVGETDPNVRATLSRLYLRTGAYAKAVAMLSELVNQEPGWQDGPPLLAEAYSGAGRTADAIKWLEQAATDDPQLFSTLADFYERERRWKEAADAYARALKAGPRGADPKVLKSRYVSALLNAGGREDVARARDVLKEILAASPNDPGALYLLSQAERRSGDPAAAEQTARRVIAQNAKSPWGYYALAEALEERRQYQAIIDALTPVVSEARSRAAGDALDLSMLLPHLGFAYQELGQHDKALPIFEEAHRLSPADPAVASYLVQANIAAKKYAAAVEIARQARADRPDDLRLARLEAQALRQNGQADQGIALLETVVKAHADDPSAYIALAQLYSDADRGAQALTVLHEGQVRFPADQSIAFELGAVYDKQKRFADAEAAFKQVIARDPEHAAALNYLGYMLAERGDRLDESVRYIKKALALEPENGSYLDSLGWAYYKADKLDLAEQNLKRAADQLTTNSVIQDHYGDVLFKRGRFNEAIAAWTRALAGDGDSIDRGAIDRKIRTARQKLGQK
jgi:tetratricopeptide (TPR) repeat protein